MANIIFKALKKTKSKITNMNKYLSFNVKRFSFQMNVVIKLIVFVKYSPMSVGTFLTVAVILVPEVVGSISDTMVDSTMSMLLMLPIKLPIATRGVSKTKITNN